MHKFSDFELDEIVDMLDAAIKINDKIKSRKEMHEYVKRDFRQFLNGKTSGIKENVCSLCLGSGYKEKQ